MNEDLDMMVLLIQNGAHPDYRLGYKYNFKTIMHVAAANNKVKSLRVCMIAIYRRIEIN